jgi:DNA (cytosine-5)-methyltransferase 1
MKPIAIDLFCGAGGMSEGILQAGFHIIFSSDINESVQTTYMNRHEQLGLIQGKNTHFELSDVRNLTKETIYSAISKLEDFDYIPKIDAVFGGPPCQGFSRAGLRRKDDPRNLLFKEYLRVIDEIKPRYVVMENVEGFLDTYLQNYKGIKGKIYKNDELLSNILLEEFNEIGYTVSQPQVLDSSDFGVPQKRKRVIFIAHLQNEYRPIYPSPTSITKKVTVKDALSDLITDPLIKENIHYKDSSYQIASKTGRTKSIIRNQTIHSKGALFNHDLSKHDVMITERFSLYHRGETTVSLIKRLTEEGINLNEYPALLRECSIKMENQIPTEEIVERFKSRNLTNDLMNALLTKKRSRYRLMDNSQSPTIVTMPDDYIHPYEDRILTVREMARLQSFDDSFIFLGKRTTGGLRRRVEVPQYTQVGNAVPPLLAKAIAIQIKKAIEQSDYTRLDKVLV